MITLGQASNYSAGQIFGQLFACGTKRDSKKLKEALAKKYQVSSDHVALYHTGRSALAAAIRAVAPAGGRNVLIPGLTCIAVIRAIKAAGCNPVFVDIEPENLEYNYKSLASELEKIRKKSRRLAKGYYRKEKVCYNGSIILVQNTLGIAWDIKKVEKLAKEYHAEIIEDLAHSAGRFYPDGREAGTVGQVAALSFGKGKAIDTISGGALIVRDGKMPDAPAKKPKLSDRLRDRWYPLFGAVARLLWDCGAGKVFIGGLVKIHFVQRSADAELDTSHRLTHWQAKLAYKQLSKLPKTPLREYKLVQDRTKLLQELEKNGYCFNEIWYDTPVSPARYADEVKFPVQRCAETVKIAEKIINIPTWYEPTKLEKAYEIIKKYEEK